jgi:hypothetical protein
MAYSNIRSLIDAAWRRAGVRGDGDTLDTGDSKLGLQLVNEELDVLSMDAAFAPGRVSRTGKAKPDGTIVIGNEPKRIITLATSIYGGPTNQTNIYTAGPHGIKMGDNLVIQNMGNLVVGTTATATVNAILSSNNFTCLIPAAETNLGTARSGTWRLATESDRCLIDLVSEPPGQVSQCVATGGVGVLNEYTQDVYESAKSAGCFTNGWYYDTSFDPYPLLHTDQGSVDIFYPQPGFRNVTLDTSIAAWPAGMDVVLLYKVAAKLAAGYPDAIAACLAAADGAMVLYKRTRKKNRATLSDGSAPGLSSRRYDFYTDSIRRD